MRRRFSERAGLIEPRNQIQLGSMDDRLRSRLWSLIVKVFINHLNHETNGNQFTQTIWYTWKDEFLGEPIDDLRLFSKDNASNMKAVFFAKDWGFCYDCVQFFADFAVVSDSGEPSSQLRVHGEFFVNAANEILEAEKAGYRLVAGELTDITSKHELAEIEAAIEETPKFAGAEQHLRTALRMYSDRENPDYRNAIKEAVSAIEAGYSALNDAKSANIAKAQILAKSKGHQMHPALEKGISSIYGWTSDEEGVRHALLEGDANVGPEEARLMLVLCSGFLNFLKAQT